MRRTAFALALALMMLSGLGSSEFVGQFPQGGGELNFSNLPNGSIVSQDGSAVMPGHIGDYSVRIGSGENGIYAIVSGAEESQPALAYEISLLIDQKILMTNCNPSALLAFGKEQEVICMNGRWSACSGSSCHTGYPGCARYSSSSGF